VLSGDAHTSLVRADLHQGIDRENLLATATMRIGQSR
jgi:hypothetical protein